MATKRRRRRRRRNHGGMDLKDIVSVPAKQGLKVGRDKRSKRMGAIGARRHYKANPRP